MSISIYTWRISWLEGLCMCWTLPKEAIVIVATWSLQPLGIKLFLSMVSNKAESFVCSQVLIPLFLFHGLKLTLLLELWVQECFVPSCKKQLTHNLHPLSKVSVILQSQYLLLFNGYSTMHSCTEKRYHWTKVIELFSILICRGGANSFTNVRAAFCHLLSHHTMLRVRSLYQFIFYFVCCLESEQFML